MEKRQSFQQILLGILDTTCKKKKKNEAGLLLNTKDRWIKHLNLRPKAIQLLEETIELKFMTEFDNDFWI